MADVLDHQYFRRLRDEEGPVPWSEEFRSYLALSYRAVYDGFRDPVLSSDRMPAFERIAQSRPAEFAKVVDLFRGWMVFRDPPTHTDLRDPVKRAFNPRSVERLSGAVNELLTPLLDAMEGAGSVELVEALARPLPAFVIAELLGVPASDRVEFQHWSDKLGTVVFAASSRQADDRDAIEAADHFDQYFRNLLAHYRRHPADNLLTRMGDAGLDDVLTIGASTLLLFGGHETTTSLITNGTYTLLSNPDARERFLADPDIDVSAIEEIMRFEGPAKSMLRWSKEPTVLDGVPIEPGRHVNLVIMAANRDPAMFADPDTLDLGRDPNPQLGFGWGMHYCIGAPLARLEGRIALRRIFERFPNIRLATDKEAWGSGLIGRSLRWLPVSVS